MPAWYTSCLCRKKRYRWDGTGISNRFGLARDLDTAGMALVAELGLARDLNTAGMAYAPCTHAHAHTRRCSCTGTQASPVVPMLMHTHTHTHTHTHIRADAHTLFKARLRRAQLCRYTRTCSYAPCRHAHAHTHRGSCTCSYEPCTHARAHAHTQKHPLFKARLRQAQLREPIG